MQNQYTNFFNSSNGEDTEAIFSAMDTDGDGVLTQDEFWKTIQKMGILKSDPRLKSIREQLEDNHEKGNEHISAQELSEIISQSILVRNALKGRLVIPDFTSFCNDIKEIYLKTKENKSGKVADYIPQLARVDPENFAVAVCTVDGQQFMLGDAEKLFCLQSTCKPINYCISHQELGEDKVHQHIGREPSGRSFNELSLNHDGLPHNPLINAGAIMCCSLIKQGVSSADRFEHVLDVWELLCGARRPFFNNSVYLSERETADRNFALAYFMRENKAFPAGTDIVQVLEFYFQCCSIEVKATDAAIAMATLANAGVNPITGATVFNSKTVQNCLSLMYSCGMYDFSGEFAFKIGLPAKSGVSGALMVVIPKVMGICIWSPKLDSVGNSVRGVEFCNNLVGMYNFHNYDNIAGVSHKKDPRFKKYQSKAESQMALMWAATYGDLDEILKLHAFGVNLDMPDYDGRTPLHLAASEGKLEAVELLLSNGCQPNPQDRWGGTPLDDAKRAGHHQVAELLQTYGGVSQL
jgi:glutaminase